MYVWGGRSLETKQTCLDIMTHDVKLYMNTIFDKLRIFAPLNVHPGVDNFPPMIIGPIGPAHAEFRI